MEQNPVSGPGVSRRSALKKIGAATAAAWAAPTLVSLDAQALAQGSAACAPYDCNFQPCPNEPTCGCTTRQGQALCFFSFRCWPCTADTECQSAFGPGFLCGDINGPACDCDEGVRTGCFDPSGCT